MCLVIYKCRPPKGHPNGCSNNKHLPPPKLPYHIYCSQSHGDLKHYQNINAGHKHSNNVQLAFMLKKVVTKTTRIFFVPLRSFPALPPLVHMVGCQCLVEIHKGAAITRWLHRQEARLFEDHIITQWLDYSTDRSQHKIEWSQRKWL